MVKKILFLVGFLFLASFVLASSNETNSALGNQIKENIQERHEIRQNIREQIKENKEIVFANKMKIRAINQEMMELRGEKGEAIRTRLNLTGDENMTELRAQLRNGRNATIKIMPEVASERALERLRLKNCNETRNCTIELKEVGVGNQTRLAYEAKAKKTFRIFGMFKNREEIQTQIDAETGEEIKTTKRPWWAWMASEAKETDSLE